MSVAELHSPSSDGGRTTPETAPLGADAVATLLPQRFPFLFLDRIDAYEPMGWARGCKGIGTSEPYLLPADARIWPMPFVVESLGQLAIALFNLSQGAAEPPKVLLGTVSGVTFHCDIPLGCRLDLDVKIERVIADQFIASGRASVNGQLCLSMDSLICKILTERSVS